MTSNADLDELRIRQEAALGVLARGVLKLEDGPDAMKGASEKLRAEMVDVLFAHQRFKHARVYDPAIESGDEHRAILARHMKVNCIAQGELLNAHIRRWPPTTIAADWPAYKVAARLTANQLRRHITTEGEGIAELIAAYPEPQDPSRE